MTHFCFFLAMIILTIAIIFAIKNRLNTSKWIYCVLMGILFAVFFMALPTQWVAEGKSVTNEFLYRIAGSLIFSIKTLSGGQDIARPQTVDLVGVMRQIYMIVCYLCFICAPILTSGLILSFIGDTVDRIRYFFSCTPKYYIFSEINENALTLAEGIKNKSGRKTIVFCNAKSADKDLFPRAKKTGALLLHKSSKELRLYHPSKEYEFFFICKNEDDNIELTERIIAKKEKLKKHNITVNTFAMSGANINVLESLMAKVPVAVFQTPCPELIAKAKRIIGDTPKTKIAFFDAQKADNDFLSFAKEESITLISEPWQEATVSEDFKNCDVTLYYMKEEHKVGSLGLKYSKGRLLNEWQEDPIKIRFIDEISLFCNTLLYENPLYLLPEGKKEISALLVGCGRLGLTMLKTIAWYGQIDGFSLKIRVLDNCAKRIQSQLYAQCPELKEYPIEFIEADVTGDGLDEAVKKCSDATFVCIATGSDDLNISLAERVYALLRRNYTGFTPPIFARVRKTIKSGNFDEKGAYLTERNIHLFGTTDSVFSGHTLFNTQLENLAFAVHLCYCWALSASKNSFEYKKALYDFYTSEYSRRSSMAVALHICAKLYGCGIITAKQIQNKEFLPNQKSMEEFKALLQDPKIKERLIRNEHERWNAFVRSEGFCTTDMETVKKYAPFTRSHKDEAARLHPCILSWEELDTFQQQYNELQKKLDLKKCDFKEYDEKIVVEIPQIIEKALELCKED